MMSSSLSKNGFLIKQGLLHHQASIWTCWQTVGTKMPSLDNVLGLPGQLSEQREQYATCFFCTEPWSVSVENSSSFDSTAMLRNSWEEEEGRNKGKEKVEEEKLQKFWTESGWFLGVIVYKGAQPTLFYSIYISQSAVWLLWDAPSHSRDGEKAGPHLPTRQLQNMTTSRLFSDLLSFSMNIYIYIYGFWV